MWQTQELETITKERLIEELGQPEGDERFALYLAARKTLLEDVLEEIKAVEPALTDHGPRHIVNVLQNSNRLLGDDARFLSAIELYCLILAVLFHDVGNIFGRNHHQLKIGDVYDHVRQAAAANRQEKLLLLQIVGAHSGEACDGTTDTLKFLEPSHLDGRRVNLRHIAAILRFADELAEGIQRTSLFMHKVHRYPRKSEIFHEYSRISELLIDKGTARIAVTYHLSIQAAPKGGLANESSLRELLQFIYRRMQKMDAERKYNKHYCPYLEPFKQLSAVFNFWVNGRPEALGLRPLLLTDLVLPGDSQKHIEACDSSYTIDEVIGKIRLALADKPKSYDQ